MRYIMYAQLMIVFLVSTLVLSAQQTITTSPRNPCLVSDFDSDPAQIHATANIFAAKVGDLLKENYPSRIVDVNVILVYKKNGIGREGFEIRWTCRWEKTTPDNADYYFDRRGTVLTNERQAQAETARKIADAQAAFQRQYGDARIYPTEVSSWTRDGRGQTWYIVERFITARR